MSASKSNSIKVDGMGALTVLSAVHVLQGGKTNRMLGKIDSSLQEMSVQLENSEKLLHTNNKLMSSIHEEQKSSH